MIGFLHYIVKYFVHDVALISCILFVILWNSLNKIESWVALLIFGCFFIDLFAASFAYKSIENLWVYNLGVYIQILFIIIIYYQLLIIIRSSDRFW